MQTRLIGITETTPGTWRVTFNGSVLGDSRGYDRAGALAEAKTFVERNGGLDGDWGPTGWVEMRNVLDPALEPKPEFAPVAPAKTESKFWAWFDGVEALALETDDGKEFAAAGFKLHHTGGGCTAWRREIPETAWSVIIVTDDAGHHLTAEDIANGGHYVVFVEHNEDISYSASEDEGTPFEAVCRANKMQGIVLAGGNFRRSLGIYEAG